ncbi:olfactory receptor 10AG1-like [Gastrophryne carolinensis]
MNTTVSFFMLLAFSDLCQSLYLLFVVLLMIYIICIVANVSIIALVMTHPSLHTPMYFFISIFSLSDIIFISDTLPKLLVYLVSDDNRISFFGCFTQMYVLSSAGLTESFLLTVMGFDRHMAIHNPLRYSMVMNPSLCTRLVMFSWIIAFGSTLTPVLITANLSFCGPNKINHYFCDLSPLQSLACSDIFSSIVSAIIVAFLEIFVPFLLVIGLYCHIITTIIKIKSNKGKEKALSTCSSQMIVVSILFGTATIVYTNPYSNDSNKYLAFLYTTCTPTVNPFIYTFRNQDVKNELKNSIYILKARFQVDPLSKLIKC